MSNDDSVDETHVWGGKFWDGVETPDESAVVTRVLRRRFPHTYALLTNCLDSADIEQIVYPDNPNEYSDVVEEALAQLAWHNNSLSSMSRDDVGKLIRSSIWRCFPEPDLSNPAEVENRGSRIETLVDLLDEGRRSLPSEEGKPSWPR